MTNANDPRPPDEKSRKSYPLVFREPRRSPLARFGSWLGGLFSSGKKGAGPGHHVMDGTTAGEPALPPPEPEAQAPEPDDPGGEESVVEAGEIAATVLEREASTPEVESADTVARRIARAVEVLGAERVGWVHPDCGFWMLHRSVADLKMAALVAGRDKFLGTT